MTQTKTINWVIAHEPADLFLAAAGRFAQEIFEKTNGRYEIKISTLTEYNKEKGTNLRFHDLVGVMEADVELSQMYTFILGRYHKDLMAIDMPYMFTDHDHADRVFEGQIGEELLAGLGEKSPVRGLAFTYSGGYKCIPSNVAIRTMEDFRGKRIRTSNNPVNQDIFRVLGAEPVDVPIEELADAGRAGHVDGGESSYIRIISSGQDKAFNAVIDAEHSMLATSIIVSNKFWKTLDAETQKIFREAAINTARIERIDSVANVPGEKAKCEESNMTLYEITGAEREKIKQATSVLYEKYKDFFANDLLNRMKNA